jgi:hypothetical protein
MVACEREWTGDVQQHCVASYCHVLWLLLVLCTQHLCVTSNSAALRFTDTSPGLAMPWMRTWARQATLAVIAACLSDASYGMGLHVMPCHVTSDT